MYKTKGKELDRRKRSMPNVRPLNEEKYQISKRRFCELYNFCLQYNEWMEELKYKTNTVGGIVITDMPRGCEKSDPTQALAVRRAELQRKCNLIRQTAKEADSEIFPYIIKAVTNEGISYNYLREFMDMPCGKDLYYNRRRMFFWLLSNKKE